MYPKFFGKKKRRDTGDEFYHDKIRASNALPDRYFPKANEYVVSEKAGGDVVFFHHAAQIPVSDWKEIRRSLMFTKGIKAAFCADIDFEYRQCMKRYKDDERLLPPKTE